MDTPPLGMARRANTLDIVYPDGHIANDHAMWTYWRLLEGEVWMPPGSTTAPPTVKTHRCCTSS